jgi:hypothetical protein
VLPFSPPGLSPRSGRSSTPPPSLDPFPPLPYSPTHPPSPLPIQAVIAVAWLHRAGRSHDNISSKNFLFSDNGTRALLKLTGYVVMPIESRAPKRLLKVRGNGVVPRGWACCIPTAGPPPLPFPPF